MRSLVFFVSVMTAIFLGGCNDVRGVSQEKLKIGTNIWPGYEPLYLARDLGYFEKNEIQLVEYTSASDVIRSFRNGLINAAALTMDEALLLQAQQFKNKVVLVLDISDGADVIVAKSGISDIQQLKGKKVGVEESALGAFVLARALDVAKLSSEDITIVPLEVSEHEEAVKSGLVDAAVTFEPVRTKLLAWGCNEIFTSKQIPDEVVDVLVVDDVYFSKNKTMVLELIEGWSKARTFMENDVHKSAQMMGKRQGMTEEQFVTSLDGLHLPTLEENRVYFKGKESSIYHNSMKLYTVLQKKGLIENTQTDVAGMFIPNWLNE